MEETLAANNRDFATPEGAANNGENAPLPAAQAAPVAQTPMEQILTEQTPMEQTSMEQTSMEQISIEAKGSEDGREWTRKVAQRIKEERQKAQTDLITELFGSEDSCNAFRERCEQERQSAEDMREAALFAELALAADPELGGHYLALQDEVLELATAHDVDVESAFMLVLRQHLPRLLREERQKGEQELLAKLAAASASPGSLTDAAAPADRLNALDDREFANMVTRVKRGEFRN